MEEKDPHLIFAAGRTALDHSRKAFKKNNQDKYGNDDEAKIKGADSRRGKAVQKILDLSDSKPGNRQAALSFSTFLGAAFAAAGIIIWIVLGFWKALLLFFIAAVVLTLGRKLGSF